MSSPANRKGRRPFHKSKHGHGTRGSKIEKSSSTVESNVDESSPVIEAFRIYQSELDSRNDRYERIVKLSRDITIESKRLIFLLQRVIGSDAATTASLLAEAADKMQELHSTKFMTLAKDLEGQDPYQFLRAFSPGLQEYIEAVTFYHYLSSQKLVGIDQIQPQLIFSKTDEVVDKTECTSSVAEDCVKEVDANICNVEQEPKVDGQSMDNSATEDSSLGQSKFTNCKLSEPPQIGADKMHEEENKILTIPIPPSEYMAGVADFTGELMRMAINSVGSGDLETPRVVANMMRVIYKAFMTFSNTSRELRRKTNVLRQSLQKVETACYALTVRGSEIPKHMLKDVFSTTSTNLGDDFGNEETEDIFD